ncbi:MAG TPA: MarR family transcriptional regulator [Caulobacter sp.]|nr:MarR family transcriptional regulator [Caulobacter sp.]
MSRHSDALKTQLTDTLRQASAQSLLISQAVAAQVGLHTTDLECLDILQIQGKASAGDLARRTGLSTGAVTALLDRLEKAGYVERLADPTDRRRVLAVPRPEAMGRLFQIYAPLRARMEALYEDYDDEQMALIIQFMARAHAVSIEFVAALRGR